MSKESVFKKVKDFIANLSSDEQKALKDFKPLEVKMKEVKTKDAKILSFDGEALAVDVMVNDITSGTPVPADGTYELEDGSTITCAAGKVTEIKPAAAPEPMDMTKIAPAIAAEVATQMSAIKLSSETQVKELKLANDTLTAQVVTLTSLMNKVLETPINTIEPAKPARTLTKEEIALEEYRERKKLFN